MPAASDAKEPQDSLDDGASTSTAETAELERVEVEDAEEQLSTAQRFKRWRRNRPFIPGLLMMISGFVIAAPAYITVQLSDILVMISTVSGVSTLLIGVLMFMFGLGCWLQPATAVYLGVLAIIVAVVALPTSNLGGFVVGSLFGIVGGSLALGWEAEDDEDADAPKKKRAKKKRVKEPEPEDDFDPFTEEAFADSEDDEGRGGSTRLGGSTLNSVVALAAATALVGLLLGDAQTVSAQETVRKVAQPAPAVQLPQLPTPQLELPQLPDVPLPSLNVPPPPGGGQPSARPSSQATTTSPTTTAPSPTPGPDAGARAAGPLAPAATPATVTADKVTITGNVHATMDYVNVAGTPKRALILTGDRLVGRNLGLQIPGFGGGAKLSTGNVDTKVIDGPVKIVATGLTATPAVRDVRTIPVTVNLDADINSVLDQLGVPDRHPVPNMEIPDMLMKEISLTGVTMEMVALYGTNFDAPSVRLTVP
ncbi:DUF6114 domain-containing protein [uncultured Corynebacterium sp.]|uniref:DUF6114 domain-containing protein n=1 Tax=uncultured Corynebacterium sp. TaxID=159447 RepID=UPI002622EE92|nr:DUF6114 domain-containing protein [uncultured Corynebacterium sp.]